MGSVIINGKTITTTGRNMSIINGKVYVDGQEVTDSEVSEAKVIQILVQGDLEDLDVDICDKIKIEGKVKGDVKTTSGSINCGDVGGDVKTVSGSVQCGNVAGKIKTVSGPILHR